MVRKMVRRTRREASLRMAAFSSRDPQGTKRFAGTAFERRRAADFRSKGSGAYPRTLGRLDPLRPVRT